MVQALQIQKLEIMLQECLVWVANKMAEEIIYKTRKKDKGKGNWYIVD